MPKFLLSGLFFLAISPISFASTITLKSGEKTEGHIIGTSKNEVYFQSDTRILNYPYQDIREITDFSAEEVIAFLKQRPDLVAINSAIVQKTPAISS